MDKKTYSNQDVAQYLQKIATAYEIKEKNFFRIRSYQDLADTISAYPKSVYKLWQKDPKLLDDIPGVGEHILTKLNYWFKTGKNHPHVITALKDIHPAVFVFEKINDIGPKIAQKLTKNLKFSQDTQTALNQLIKYAQNNKISPLEGFGQKSQQQILTNTKNFLGKSKRIPFKKAQKISQRIIKYMQKKFPDTKFVALGSLRRKADTVGDIDLAARNQHGQKILDHFDNYPLNIQTIIKGPKKTSIKIKGDIRVDLMVQPKKRWGSLLQHFTGSKQHNINLRRYAKQRDLSLSEYGIKDIKTKKIHTFSTEKDFYNFLHLCYIPPSKRNGSQEIEQAKKCYTKTVKN